VGLPLGGEGCDFACGKEGDGLCYVNPSPSHFTGLYTPLSSERESHTA